MRIPVSRIEFDVSPLAFHDSQFTFKFFTSKKARGSMLTIQLKDLLFRSFHGVYQEETILGGDFEVNVTVDFLPPADIIRQLDETLNYETLFEMVKQKMDKPTPLLETIAMELAGEILRDFNGVNRVWVAIEKKNPPIPGLTGSVQVSYTAIGG